MNALAYYIYIIYIILYIYIIYIIISIVLKEDYFPYYKTFMSVFFTTLGCTVKLFTAVINSVS
jgi:hypothetical protein